MLHSVKLAVGILERLAVLNIWTALAAIDAWCLCHLVALFLLGLSYSGKVAVVRGVHLAPTSFV